MDSETLSSLFKPHMLDNFTSWATSFIKLEHLDGSIAKQKVLDTYESLQEFKFKPGETPLSTWEIPAITVVTYVVLIFLLKQFVKCRGKSFDLKKIVLVHNSVLAFASLLLWIGLTTEVVSLLSLHGLHDVLFDTANVLTYGRHTAYYYINYIFKYIELMDTVMLALQGKPIIFLHEYHHAATLILCWVQLSAGTCMQWVVIELNLFVHVVMYSYYALSTKYRNIWWKRYLTTLQILQFVISVFTGCVVLGFRCLGDLGFSWAPKGAGSYESAIFGLAILLSYLILFLQLYRQKYPEQQVKLVKVKRSSRNSKSFSRKASSKKLR